MRSGGAAPKQALLDKRLGVRRVRVEAFGWGRRRVNAWKPGAYDLVWQRPPKGFMRALRHNVLLFYGPQALVLLKDLAHLYEDLRSLVWALSHGVNFRKRNRGSRWGWR